MAPAASDYVEEDLLSLVGISRDELRFFFSEQVRDQTVAFWYENAFDGKSVPVYLATWPGAMAECGSARS